MQPGCVACQSEPKHATDWFALYARRAGMPTAFPLACDSVRACTAAGPLPGSGPRSESHGDFEKILCWTHTIMLCCEGCEDAWLRGGQIGSQWQKACVSWSLSSDMFNPINLTPFNCPASDSHRNTRLYASPEFSQFAIDIQWWVDSFSQVRSHGEGCDLWKESIWTRESFPWDNPQPARFRCLARSSSGRCTRQC